VADVDSRPPAWSRPEEALSGHLVDPVDRKRIATVVVVSGIWIAIMAGAGAFGNLALAGFVLIFPAFGLVLIARALTAATLLFDRSGWHYRREVLGQTLDTCSGHWDDTAWTAFRQWIVQGRNTRTLYGAFSVADPGARMALDVWTSFSLRGGAGSCHATGRSQIGVTEGDFRRFIRFVNGATPHLDYEWVPVPGAELVPGPRSFFARAGADRFARVPRGGTPPFPAEPPKPTNLPA